MYGTTYSYIEMFRVYVYENWMNNWCTICTFHCIYSEDSSMLCNNFMVDTIQKPSKSKDLYAYESAAPRLPIVA